MNGFQGISGRKGSAGSKGKKGEPAIFNPDLKILPGEDVMLKMIIVWLLFSQLFLIIIAI